MQNSESVRFIVEKTNVIVGINRETRTPPKWDRIAFLRQLLAALSAIVGSISFGMTTGFSATLLPQLAKSSLFVVDENSESWIASTVVLSMPIGVVMGSFLMRYMGRKKAQILIYLPWMVGWIGISLVTGFWVLLTGCALLGIGAGSSSVMASVYIGETSEPRYRGLISIQMSLGVALGIMLSHLQGIFLSWRMAVGISSLFPLMAFTMAFLAPESPTWLVLRGRVGAAKKVFMWLRNDALESEDELNTLIDKVSEYNRNEGNITKRILSKGFLKPFFILIVLFVAQQGSGMNVLVFYTVKTFQTMSTDLNVNVSMIVVDVVRLIAVIVASLLIKKTGRRWLYFASAWASLLALMGIIASVIFQFSNMTLVVFTCAYILFLYAGVAPLPWVMVGELYPANSKEIGVCVTSFFGFTVMFVVIKTAPFLMLHLGMTVMFITYGIIIVVNMIILFYVMPETNNISLQQVEDNMKK